MRNRGFTLLEMLVAVTVTLLLAGIMLSVTTESMALWRRSQAKSSAATQAKFVLDQLEQDLQGAIFRNDGRFWLSINIDNDQGVLASRGWLFPPGVSPKPSDQSLNMRPTPEPGSPNSTISRGRFGMSGVWLRLIATNIDAGGSQPVAISYQINRRPVTGLSQTFNPSETRYLFLRKELSSASTFPSIFAELFSGKNVPASLVTADAQDTFAVNVVDFGIWLYRRDASNQLSPIFPESDNSPLSFSLPQTGLFPTVADVMIRVLSDEGAARIAAMEAGLVTRPAEFASNPAGWWWSIVEANSQVFVRRVELRSSAP